MYIFSQHVQIELRKQSVVIYATEELFRSQYIWYSNPIITLCSHSVLRFYFSVKNV